MPFIDEGTDTANACVEPNAKDEGELVGLVMSKAIPGAVTVMVWLAETLTAPAAFSHSATTITVPAAVGVKRIGTTALLTVGAIPVVPVVAVVAESVPSPVLPAPLENRID